ncbi:hypothetical protein BGW41_000344 [Actinomortierella wolfii]|nr:hypothetical protein BGW41_000344 [Actinomortierella wolfii]
MLEHTPLPDNNSFSSELILYLEPRPASKLRQAIDSLLVNTSLALGHNEAQRFMPHVTMVGFFSVPDTATTEAIQASLNTALPACFAPSPSAAASSVLPKATKVLQPTPHLVLIDIEPSQGCIQLVQHLKSSFPSLNIRPKAVNHLSLCYWLDSDINKPPPEARQSIAAAIAEQARHQLPLPAEDAQWDIVLYSIQNRNQQGQEPYPLQQVHRWQLVPL